MAKGCSTKGIQQLREALTREQAAKRDWEESRRKQLATLKELADNDCPRTHALRLVGDLLDGAYVGKPLQRAAGKFRKRDQRHGTLRPAIADGVGSEASTGPLPSEELQLQLQHPPTENEAMAGNITKRTIVEEFDNSDPAKKPARTVEVEYDEPDDEDLDDDDDEEEQEEKPAPRRRR